MIEVEHLSKAYGRVRAVDDLTFRVQPGHVTGFLGPNGAGKTTTMRLILGLDVPDEGHCTVLGQSYVDLKAPLTVVGALLDAGAFHPGRSAREHLHWLATTNSLPARRVDEVLERVGLSSAAHRRAGTFSLGMRQRLGIAATLLGEPSVLIFDEPVNGLDPEGIVWVRNLLKSLGSEGKTVLVSSHLMSEMALTVDHLIVIGRGKLIAEASVEDFLERAVGSSTYVVSPDGERFLPVLLAAGARLGAPSPAGIEVFGLDHKAIGELAHREGVVLYELTPRRVSLEEAYMDLTADSLEFVVQTLEMRDATQKDPTQKEPARKEPTRKEPRRQEPPA